MDIEALNSLGYTASGWDPAFRPGAPKTEADVVNLGYVLNVIEEPSERIIALRNAFASYSVAYVKEISVLCQEIQEFFGKAFFEAVHVTPIRWTLPSSTESRDSARYLPTYALLEHPESR